MELDEEDSGSPWGTIGIGLLCIAFSVFLFWYFAHWENEGGTARMWWVLAILYKIGGKWLASGLVGFVGILVSGLGVKELISER